MARNSMAMNARRPSSSPMSWIVQDVGVVQGRSGLRLADSTPRGFAGIVPG